MGGQQDLEKKVLRCVGKAELRFREDALRMLRALRFSAQLGFEIEAETLRAIGDCAPLCRVLSAERVREEVEKTLLSPRPQMIGRMVRLGLLAAFGLTEARDLSLLDELPAEATVRWSGLCKLHPELELKTLRLDRRTYETAMAAARVSEPENTVQWKQLIAREGVAVAETAAKLWGRQEELRCVLASGECICLKELAVSGHDLSWLQGKAVGEALHKLLAYVWEHPDQNKKEHLLHLLQEHAEP